MLQPFPDEVFIFKCGAVNRTTPRWWQDWAARMILSICHQRDTELLIPRGLLKDGFPCSRTAQHALACATTLAEISPCQIFHPCPTDRGSLGMPCWNIKALMACHTHPPTMSLPSTTTVISYRNQHFLWYQSGSVAGFLTQQYVLECCK